MKVFAVTHRGLEAICAEEIAELPTVIVSQVTYRCVFAGVESLPPLLNLRTADDIFLHLDTWKSIETTRTALAQFTELASKLPLQESLRQLYQVRQLGYPPAFSVTVNFVGKRNYSTNEIKTAIASGISQQNKRWRYSLEDHECDINIRVFIEHSQAFVGLRIPKSPLGKRPYKLLHLPGSLSPPVAASMVRLATDGHNGGYILDPCCGAGTILIEAALMGCSVLGGDLDVQALASASRNMRSAGLSFPLSRWDALNLPLPDHSVAGILSNLPWGRQVTVEHSPALFYRSLCAELERVLSVNGVLVLLTTSPDLLSFTRLKINKQIEISLFGQTPTLLVLSQNTHHLIL